MPGSDQRVGGGAGACPGARPVVSAVTPSISMASNGSTVVSAWAAASRSLNGKLSGTFSPSCWSTRTYRLTTRPVSFLFRSSFAVDREVLQVLLPDGQPFLELRGRLAEVARLVGLGSLVEELPGLDALLGHLGLAPLFPVGIVHLAGPAIAPVFLVLVEVLEPLGHGPVVDPDLVANQLAVAIDQVGRLEDVLAELDPLAEGPGPLVLGDLAEGGLDPQRCSSSRAPPRSGSGRGRASHRKAMSSGRPLRWGVGSTYWTGWMSSAVPSVSRLAPSSTSPTDAAEPAVAELEVILLDHVDARLRDRGRSGSLRPRRRGRGGGG